MILTAGGVAIRNRSPASTSQPRASNARTVAASSRTGIQTFSPERPKPVIPCSPSAAINACRWMR